MNILKTISKDLYYTNDHEWVDFKGSVAYTGVCTFKLIGFKEIQQITFGELGLMKQGDVIATIRYNDYKIEAHMPVEGKLVQVNEKLFSGNSSMLLQNAETSGWIAMIFPLKPYERGALMLPKQYLMGNAAKHI